jgi:hypothetical protein
VIACEPPTPIWSRGGRRRRGTNPMKTTEQRDTIRENNRRRKNCSRCGAPTRLLSGLNDESHFPGVVYKCCDGCGHEVATRKRAP